MSDEGLYFYFTLDFIHNLLDVDADYEIKSNKNSYFYK